MPAVATVVELEQPLVLAPEAAARYLRIRKRDVSRLIADGKIAARKHGPRTLVDVGALRRITPTCRKDRSCADRTRAAR
jgi:hypothetical protein